MSQQPGVQGGRRVLVVEDESFLADDLASALAAAGAEVVGPVPSVGRALEMLAGGHALDHAILDINLRGEPVFAVADALQASGTPFVFVTGYDDGMIPERFAGVPRHRKPVDAAQVAEALLR